MLSWLPENASNLASGVDNVLLFVTVLSVFFFLLISAFLIGFAIKYRRKADHDETPYITGNELIEVIWTVIPSVLLMIIFAWGYIEYREMRNPPDNAVEVNVVARQWLWQFDYYNGKKPEEDEEKQKKQQQKQKPRTIPTHQPSRSDAYLKAFHTQSIMDYVSSESYKTQTNFQRYIDTRAEHLREQGVVIELMH